MNQNAINYLRENKDKYPADILRAQLVKSGYSEQDINESLKAVYGDYAASCPNAALRKINFWDFKSPVIYVKNSDKIRIFSSDSCCRGFYIA